MSILYDTVKTVVVYLILVAIVMNLLGTSSYKKYVAMFTGMLLIYIVITPVIKVLKLSDTMDYYFEENYFKVEAGDMNTKLYNADAEQKEYILKEYKEKIKLQIEDKLINKNLTIADCELKLDDDSSSETFGSVLGINLIAQEIHNENQESNRDLIKEIYIEKVEIGEEQKKKEENKLDTPNAESVLEIAVREELEQFYNLDREAIIVHIK